MDHVAQAAANEAFLAQKLGARYAGLEFDGTEFVVTVFRPGGKRVWYQASTPEKALAVARADVERELVEASCPIRSTPETASPARPVEASSTKTAARTQASLPMTSGDSPVASPRHPVRSTRRSASRKSTASP
jgi:hypothetical protein